MDQRAGKAGFIGSLVQPSCRHEDTQVIDKSETLALSPEESVQDLAAFSSEDAGGHRDGIVQCGVVARPLYGPHGEPYEMISGSMARSTTWPLMRLT
jgi:hypothetical protein